MKYHPFSVEFVSYETSIKGHPELRNVDKSFGPTLERFHWLLGTWLLGTWLLGIFCLWLASHHKVAHVLHSL